MGSNPRNKNRRSKIYMEEKGRKGKKRGGNKVKR
jgi:hypothetical protein